MKSLLLLFIVPLFLIVNVPIKTSCSNTLDNIKKDAKKLAEYYRQRVIRGESMASVVKLYSEDTGSAINVTRV